MLRTLQQKKLIVKQGQEAERAEAEELKQRQEAQKQRQEAQKLREEAEKFRVEAEELKSETRIKKPKGLKIMKVSVGKRSDISLRKISKKGSQTRSLTKEICSPEADSTSEARE